MKRLAFAIFLAFVTTCHADVITGRVVGVIDGDTIDILDATRGRHRIRLAGIDAPEKRQPYGEKSKQTLSGLVFDREVMVETHKQDRYGRRVGKVVVGRVNANIEQIRQGMAWFYRDYQQELSEADREAYEVAERLAQQERTGLWADDRPTPPWTFRRK